MQTFENDTNCAEKDVNIKFICTRSISYWNCHRICSKYPPLTCIQAHRCISQVHVSLVNCQESSSVNRTTLSHTHSPRHCLVFGAGNTRVHITRSNSPDINPVDYTICGVAQLHGCILHRFRDNHRQVQNSLYFLTPHAFNPCLGGSPGTISVKVCMEVNGWVRYKMTYKYCRKF